MIDVNKLIISTRKKEIFSGTAEENHAAVIVLGELKTKYVDIKEEITSKLQHKLLSKMLNDRSKSMEIYKQANRLDKFEAEEHEYNIIKYLLAEVEKDLPKQMTEPEIIEKINSIVINSGKTPNIGMIMAGFKELPADKALVSKLAKEFISTYAS